MKSLPYYDLNYSYDDSHAQQFDALNLGHMVNRVVYLHECIFRPRQSSIQDQSQLLTKIYQESNKIPVVCLDTNLFDNLDHLAAALNHQIDVPFFILGCDARAGVYQHSQVGYWPYWLIQQQSEKNYQLSKEKQHRISFLSGIPRSHRLRLFASVLPWIDDQDVVVSNRLPYACDDLNHYDYQELLEMLPWANKSQWLDIAADSTYIYTSQQNNHAAYLSCVNITAESAACNSEQNYDYSGLHFITEKTWKAYRSGCLVINYGIDNLPSTLEHYGFRIWKDYDICGTLNQNIDRIVDLFKQQDIFDLYNQNIQTVQHNQNLVMSQQLALHMADSAITKLSTLLDTV